MFRTPIRTATGTGTKQQEEKTSNVEGGEEKDEMEECGGGWRSRVVSYDFSVILTHNDLI